MLTGQLGLQTAHLGGGKKEAEVGRGGQHRPLVLVCSLESSLKSKDHGAGNAKARGRERGKD